MTAPLLTPADQMEQLSCAYVRALAADAGFTVSIPHPDRDSIDLTVSAGGPRRPSLQLQLKATTQLESQVDGTLPFRLSAKNYNDLREEEVQVPRLLVVVELPQDPKRWVEVTAEALLLRRRAYWFSLRGEHAPPDKQETVTVRVPISNVLDVDVFCDLMERSRRGDF